MKNYINRIAVSLIAIVTAYCFTNQVQAFNKKNTAKETVLSSEQLYDLSLEDNLVTPDLGSQRKNIKEYQRVQARKLAAAGYYVETTRGGEVIIVTIQSDELFTPNTKTLKPKASKLLHPFVNFLNVPDMYRMMLVMHSDNTGTEKYTDNLSNDRVLVVLDWFQKQTKNTEYVIPYGMGAADPLYPNNSMDNRSNNRRLEIYLVPGNAMIKKSEHKALIY